LWGVNLGAYVVLSEAIGDTRVRVLVAESPYDRPEEMVGLLVGRTGLGSLPLITPLAKWGFRWVNRQYGKVPPIEANIGNLRALRSFTSNLPMSPHLPPVQGNSSRRPRRRMNWWFWQTGIMRACWTTTNGTTKTAW